MLVTRKDSLKNQIKAGSKLKVVKDTNRLIVGDKVEVKFVVDVIGGDGTLEPYAALFDRGEPVLSQNTEPPCYLMPLFPLWKDWYEIDNEYC